MSSSIVSLRIPKSLIRELKQSMKQDHFLDLSDAVRSIIRKRWLEHSDPFTYQIKQLRREIKSLKHDDKNKPKQQILLEELERIKDIIKGIDQIK